MTTPEQSSATVLIDRANLRRRISELAEEINRDYADREQPLVCIGVLKGSVFFLVDLLKQVRVPIVIDFLQTSSYRAGTEPGEVRIRKDIDVAIRGRDVLLIEDIVDTGLTLDFLKKHLEQHKPREVKICALIDKLERRERYVDLDYVGFEVAQGYLIGYGLDAAEEYRCLADIYELKL